MSFNVWRLYQCPCTADYGKNVVIDMKITISGLIHEMLEVLNEAYIYEHFPSKNAFFVTYREHLIKTFYLIQSFAVTFTTRDILLFTIQLVVKLIQKFVK